MSKSPEDHIVAGQTSATSPGAGASKAWHSCGLGRGETHRHDAPSRRPAPPQVSVTWPAGIPITVALLWCPEVPRGTRYSLLAKSGEGHAICLFEGVLIDAAPSLNLARLRRRGACLGADAVVLVLPQDYVT